MFRRKKSDDIAGAKPGMGEGEGAHLSAPPLKPFSSKGSHMGPSQSTSPPARTDLPRRGAEPQVPRRRHGEAESKKLTVGRDICLSGDISSCNKLVVEGHVEASLTDAHAIEIAPTGYFKGTAEVDEADISGLYEGELQARTVLTVRTGGRVHGTVRYGRIIIESGGEISGDMRALSQSPAEAPEAEPRGPGANSNGPVEAPLSGKPTMSVVTPPSPAAVDPVDGADDTPDLARKA